jgi:hypothetical protein
MGKIYIGIDNGVSGSIGIITDNEVSFLHTPIKRCLNYTKTKQYLNRIDVEIMNDIFEQCLLICCPEDFVIFIERPLVNPRMFKATLSAVRALESTLTILENLRLPYEYIDSKEWQKEMLPSGIKGSKELKEASLQVGIRMFPFLKETIKKQKDADGILIAKYMQRKQL